MTSSLTEGADHSHRCAQRASQRAGAAHGPVSLNGSGAAGASRSGSLEAVGGHVYPLPAGQDPRFSLALLVGVGEVLERHGFPTPAPLDWVELQEALGRFLFRERDVEVRQTGGAR